MLHNSRPSQAVANPNKEPVFIPTDKEKIATVVMNTLRRESPEYKLTPDEVTKAKRLLTALKSSNKNVINQVSKDLFGPINEKQVLHDLQIVKSFFDYKNQQLQAKHLHLHINTTLLLNAIEIALSKVTLESTPRVPTHTEIAQALSTSSEEESPTRTLIEDAFSQVLLYAVSQNTIKTDALSAVPLTQEVVQAFIKDSQLIQEEKDVEYSKTLKNSSLLKRSVNFINDVFLPNRAARLSYETSVKKEQYERERAAWEATQRSVANRIEENATIGHTKRQVQNVMGNPSTNTRESGSLSKEVLNSSAFKDFRKHIQGINKHLLGSIPGLTDQQQAALMKELGDENNLFPLFDAIRNPKAPEDPERFHNILQEIYSRTLTPAQEQMMAARMQKGFAILMQKLSEIPDFLKIHEKYFPKNLRGKKAITADQPQVKTPEKKPINKDLPLVSIHKLREEEEFKSIQTNGSEGDRRRLMEQKVQFDVLSKFPDNIMHLETYVDLDLDDSYEDFFNAIIYGVQEFRTLAAYKGFLLDVAKKHTLETQTVQAIFGGIDELIKAKGKPKIVEIPKKDYDVFETSIQTALISELLNNGAITEYFMALFKVDVSRSYGFLNTLMTNRRIEDLEIELFSSEYIPDSERGLFQNVMFSQLGLIEKDRKVIITKNGHIKKTRQVTPQTFEFAAREYLRGLAAKNTNNDEEVPLDPEAEKVDILYDIFTTANGSSSDLIRALTYKMSPEGKRSIEGTILQEMTTILENGETFPMVIRTYESKRDLSGTDRQALHHAMNNLAGLGKKRNPQNAISELLRQYSAKPEATEVKLKTISSEDLAKRKQAAEKRIITDLLDERHAENREKLFGTMNINVDRSKVTSLDSFIQLLATSLSKEEIHTIRSAVSAMVSIATQGRMDLPTTHAIQEYLNQNPSGTEQKNLKPGISGSSLHTSNYGKYQ